MGFKKLETSEEKEARLAKNRDGYRKKGKRNYRGSSDLKNFSNCPRTRFKIAANERNHEISNLK
jgi:hypothetical protein